MKKSKVAGIALSGALAIGAAFGVASNAFAAEGNSTVVEKARDTISSLSDETQEKVQGIMDGLKVNLAQIGIELPEKGSRIDKFANLDDATKEKAQSIMDQKKAGTITAEEAESQLAELGVELPQKGHHRDKFANLDEETKEKAQSIMDQKKAGSITAEEAESQLAELGVELPQKGHHRDMFADLDEDTREKAESLIDEAKEQLEQLGVEHLPFGRQNGSETN